VEQPDFVCSGRPPNAAVDAKWGASGMTIANQTNSVFQPPDGKGMFISAGETRTFPRATTTFTHMKDRTWDSAWKCSVFWRCEPTDEFRGSWRRTNSVRRGFTLTEMLVVITVIVLLLAMAIPLFRVMSSDRSLESAQNIVSRCCSGRGRGRSDCRRRAGCFS